MVRYDDGSWPWDGRFPDDNPPGCRRRQCAGAGRNSSSDRARRRCIGPRHATLQGIEQSTGKPVARYVETTFPLSDTPADTGGLFEPSATFGRAMPDLLNIEGNYTFHARATYGHTSRGMRDLTWSLHIDVGIDPGKTTVTTTPLGPQPDGSPGVRLTITPKDRYGNLVGPGRKDDFTVGPVAGTAPIGPVVDLGDGSYQVDVTYLPDSIEPHASQSLNPSEIRLLLAHPMSGCTYIASSLFAESRTRSVAGAVPYGQVATPLKSTFTTRRQKK